MKILACILFFLPALVQADERLWGTWEGIEDGETVIITFAEDGSFRMTSPEMIGAGLAIEEIFEEIFIEIGLSFDEIKALGFEFPTLTGATLVGRWETDGDSIKVWLVDALVELDGGSSLSMSDFMLEVLIQMSELPLDEETLAWINAFIILMPVAMAEVEGQEELIIEETFYFLNGQLILTDGFSDPLVLSRVEDSETAVRSATWGQIKSGGW